MKINIRATKIEITDAIKEYTEKKLAKLNKYFGDDNDITANVVIKPKGVEQKVEITIPIKKVILRAEEANKDFYAAIDYSIDKLERQIRKNKTRMKKNIGKESIKELNLDFDTPEEKTENKIVRRKNIDTKPMSEEEAILQMELLGHPFYIFKNDKTGDVNILYKRTDNDYGIIEVTEN